MSSTTLASQLHATFSKFLEEGRSSPAGSSVINVWSRVFPDDENILRSVSQLTSDLNRLTQQYSDVETYNEAFTVFNSGISPFRELLEPHNFPTQWANFQSKLNNAAFGSLIMIRSALAQSYPQAALDKSTADELASSFEELSDEVSNSSLPQDIRDILRRQILFIVSCLRSVELIGVQALYDALAAGMMTVARAPAPSDDSEAANNSDAIGIVDRAKGLFNRTYGALEVIEKAAKGYERVKQFGVVVSALFSGASDAR